MTDRGPTADGTAPAAALPSVADIARASGDHHPDFRTPSPPVAHFYNPTGSTLTSPPVDPKREHADSRSSIPPGTGNENSSAVANYAMDYAADGAFSMNNLKNHATNSDLRIQAPETTFLSGPTPVSPGSSFSASTTPDTPDGPEAPTSKRRRLAEDPTMAVAAAAATATTSTISLFLEKTFDMLDKSAPAIVSWSPTGDSFIVKNPVEFAESVIPIYFKHKNFSSFVRQLNFYGFRKVRVVDPEVTGGVDPKDWWEFRHDKFLRGRKELLKEIKRRTLPSSSSSSSSSSSASASTGGQSGDAGGHTGAHGGRSLMDRQEIDELRTEVCSLREQIQQLNKHILGVMQIVMLRNSQGAAAGSMPLTLPLPLPPGLGGISTTAATTTTAPPGPAATTSTMPLFHQPPPLHPPHPLHQGLLSRGSTPLNSSTRTMSTSSAATAAATPKAGTDVGTPTIQGKKSRPSALPATSAASPSPASSMGQPPAFPLRPLQSLAAAATAGTSLPQVGFVPPTLLPPTSAMTPAASTTGGDSTVGAPPALASVDWEAFNRQQFEIHQRLLSAYSTSVIEASMASRATSTTKAGKTPTSKKSSSVPAVAGLKRTRSQPRSALTPTARTSSVPSSMGGLVMPPSQHAAAPARVMVTNPDAAVRQMSQTVTQIRSDLLGCIIVRILNFIRLQPTHRKFTDTMEIDKVAEMVGEDILHKLVEINQADARTHGRPANSAPSETSLMYRVEILKFVSKELPRAVQESVEKRLPPQVKKALNRSLLAQMVQKAQAAIETQMRVESAPSPIGSSSSLLGR